MTTSKIYTKTGDQGVTSLHDGTRVSKASLRVEAYGTIDEANAWIGGARSSCRDEWLDKILEFTAHRFYNCSSNIAASSHEGMATATVDQDDIEFLEHAVDMLEERTGQVEVFVLPGGNNLSSMLHIARTICRRAERLVWALEHDSHEHVDHEVLEFINRASDLLFAAARYAASIDGGSGDIPWNKDLPIPEL